jgi:hypothetical protein
VPNAFFFNIKLFIMASIQLGLVITDIAGSIGGSTIRRTPRGHILYNKQGRQIKSAFSANSVKNKIGSIFSSWNNLPTISKDEFNRLANLYPFTNKFGKNIFLSGRQLYVKLNSQLIPTNTEVDLDNFDSNLQTAVIDTIVADVAASEIIVNFDKFADNTYLYISGSLIRTNGTIKPTLKRKPFFVSNVYDVQEVNIFDEMTNYFNGISVGDTFALNCEFVTLSGFKCSVQSFVVVYQ